MNARWVTRMARSAAARRGAEIEYLPNVPAMYLIPRIGCMNRAAPLPKSSPTVWGGRAATGRDTCPEDHTHGPGASLPDRGDSEAHLAEHGDDDLECMTTAATIPTQAAPPDALTLP